MSVYFEKVSKYKDIDLPLPKRATKDSAGYDFAVAEDTIIPPYDYLCADLRTKIAGKEKVKDYFGFNNPFTLDEVKKLNAKLTLVPTGMKCKMEPNQYLELVIRSSVSLNNWLMLANSCAIIDSDFYNSENEGHIFFQVINFFPFAIKLKRGDRIGQGIIKTYDKISDDKTEGERCGGFGSSQ